MKQIVIITIFICTFQAASAQVFFQKCYGTTKIEIGNSVEQTTDGGFIIAGTAVPTTLTNADYYVVKTNASGDTLWTKTFGGPDNDYAQSVKQTSDGGYIIGGYTYGSSFGSLDASLIKLDSSGNVTWSKNIGSSFMEQCKEVQQTSDGGYIIYGSSDQASLVILNMYLVKTDSMGNVAWAKNYGGGGTDWAATGAQTSDGGYILAGRAHSFTGGAISMYVVKTDSTGDTLWTKNYSDPFDRYIWSIAQTSDRGYIIGGNKSCNGTSYECVSLIKTDTIGNIEWAKSYETGLNSHGNSVQQTSDGGYAIAGMTSGSAYLVKTNSTGDTLWTRVFGNAPGQTECFSMKQTDEGGYILTGQRSNGSNDYDVYLAKLDSTGFFGCLENPVNTTVVSDTFQVINPPTIQNTVADNSANVALVTGSGGDVTVLCISEGIHETSDDIFNISPNPSAGIFNVNFKNSIPNGKIEIVSILGEIVFSEKIFNETTKYIHLSSVPGIYIVKVYNAEKYFCGKIVVD